MTPQRIEFVCVSCRDLYSEPLGAVADGSRCPKCREKTSLGNHPTASESVAINDAWERSSDMREFDAKARAIRLRGVEEIWSEVLM